MTRLIDVLSRGVYEERLLNVPDVVRRSIDTVKRADCEIVVADNVSNYMYSVSDKLFVEFGIEDFPNVAPIFESVFIEWKAPTKISRGDGTYDSRPDYKGWFSGVHIMSERCSEGWKCVSLMYTANRDRAYFTGWTNYDVDKLGAISRTGDVRVMDKAVSSWGDLSSLTDSQKSLLICSQNLYPAFIALSFAHCKNVELKTVVPPIALSKKHKKKTGNPLVRYKILEIEPMKKVLRTEGNSETLGIRHALHICRGHFKDYSKGGGLFGKYKGLYWWESHVRGDLSNGVVVKDYGVNLESK